MMENTLATISKDENAFRGALTLLGLLTNEVRMGRCTSAVDRGIVLDEVQKLEKKIDRLEKAVQGLLKEGQK